MPNHNRIQAPRSFSRKPVWVGFSRSFLAAAFSVLLLASCGASAPGAGTASHTLSPPLWLQGNWGVTADTVFFRITSDNVVNIGVAAEIDFSALPATAQVEDETPTDTRYVITWGSVGVSQTLSFEQTSATTLTYRLTTNGITTSLDLVKHPEP